MQFYMGFLVGFIFKWHCHKIAFFYMKRVEIIIYVVLINVCEIIFIPFYTVYNIMKLVYLVETTIFMFIKKS